MSRYSKETIAAKFEWEGDDAVKWFRPAEVPVEVEDLWRRAWEAKETYDNLTGAIYDWLDDDE